MQSASGTESMQVRSRIRRKTRRAAPWRSGGNSEFRPGSNREPVRVTHLGLLLVTTPTPSASEGAGYPRWRFALVCPECGTRN